MEISYKLSKVTVAISSGLAAIFNAQFSGVTTDRAV